MMEAIIACIKGLILNYGYWGIFLITTTEQFFFPVPIDVFLGFAIQSGLPYDKVMLLVVLSTFLGATAGYLLGKYLGHPAFEWLFGKKKIIKGEGFINKWGILGIIITGFFPIVPFQVMTWIAGIFKMPLRIFLLGVLLGRIPRYFITAYAGATIIGMY